MIRIAYIAAAVSVMICAVPAFAQDTQNAPQPAATPTMGNDSANGSQNSGVGMDTNGQMASGSPAGLTRAEVNQQLYQAEADGQIKMLDRTVYKGN
jgi:hypothetical protein